MAAGSWRSAWSSQWWSTSRSAPPQHCDTGSVKHWTIDCLIGLTELLIKVSASLISSYCRDVPPSPQFYYVQHRNKMLQFSSGQFCECSLESHPYQQLRISSSPDVRTDLMVFWLTWLPILDLFMGLLLATSWGSGRLLSSLYLSLSLSVHLSVSLPLSLCVRACVCACECVCACARVCVYDWNCMK